MSLRPHQVQAVKEKGVKPIAHISLPSDWSARVIAEEQQDDPDLGWIIKRKVQSEVMPTPDEIRELSVDVKTLVPQWPQLDVQQGLLKRR